MKAILIEPAAGIASKVEVGDYRDMQTLIGGLFTIGGELPNGDTVFVDDEGLLKSPEHFVLCPAASPHPLAGNMLILGPANNDGDSTDVQSEISELDFACLDKFQLALYMGLQR